mgnify:CR=1 FL=1
MIGIAIAAVGIPRETVRRCYQSLADARINVPYRVHVQTVCEPFSRAAARNQAILALIPHCDQIVCLDVDCLVPPGLVEFAAQNIRDGQAIWAVVRDIHGFDGRYHWQQWMQAKLRHYGTGGFIGMTTADWLLVGGWGRCGGRRWFRLDRVSAGRRRANGRCEGVRPPGWGRCGRRRCHRLGEDHRARNQNCQNRCRNAHGSLPSQIRPLETVYSVMKNEK